MATIFDAYAQPVRSVADYMGDADMRDLRRAQLQGATQTNAMQALTMDQSRQTMEQTQNDNALIRAAYANSGSDPKALLQTLRMAGTPGTLAHADAFEKRTADLAETQAKTMRAAGTTPDQVAKTDKETWETQQARRQASIQHVASLATPEQAMSSINGDSNLSMKERQQLVDSMPRTQAEFRDWQLRAISKLATPQQQAELGMPKMVAAGGALVNTNPLAGPTGQGAPSAIPITQDANSIASNARIAADNAATRAQAERHFTVQQNVPKYMETDAGLVVLPTRLAPGQVPVGQSVAGADGQPLGKPLKSLPPSVNDAVIGNAQSLYSLDKAIALLQGKKVDSAKGDPAATGWKGYLPQAVLNRVDPSGVDTRAELSDIGSLKIHDRSGAAVTVSESPRLMPFIPTSTDPPEVAIRKLTRLMEEAQRNQQALSDTYSKEQGYKPSPVKPGAAKAGAAPPAKTGSGATVSKW